MLRALADPYSFAVLLLSFVLAVTLLGWVSSSLAARTGDRGVRAEGRTRPDPRRHVDPFGTVGAVLGGLGWARPLELGRSRPGRAVLVLLTGPLLLVAAGLGLVALVSADGELVLGGGAVYALQEGVGALEPGQEALLLLGLTFVFTGVLALVPLPPLPGGVLLLALAPRTPGWQKAELQLVERNIGLAVLLALVLLPLGGPLPVLPSVLDEVLAPLLRAVSGG